MIIENVTKELMVFPVYDGNRKLRDSVYLYPGWNETPLGFWSYLKGRIMKQVEQYERLKIHAPEKDEAGEIIDKGIGDIRADLAKKYISQCSNLANLKGWANDPALNADLRNAAEIQLNTIRKHMGVAA